MRPSWKRNASPRERFESRVVRGEGCWSWPGSTTADGYASTRILGKSTRVHRIAYELYKGAIPAGLVLDHLCRNRVPSLHGLRGEAYQPTVES